MKRKKIITLLLIIATLTMITLPILATTDNNEYILLNQGTEEDVIKNQRNLKKIQEEWANTPSLHSNVSKQLSVTASKQERSYWCGPANIKQVIQFINGSSSSQSTYATSMKTDSTGTYVYRMTNELNLRQSKFTYAYEEVHFDVNGMQDRILRNTTLDKPIILHARTEYLYMYNGTSLGHYLTVSGYWIDTTAPGPQSAPRAYYVDPFYKDYGRGSVFGTHSDTIQNIFNCVNNRFVIL